MGITVSLIKSFKPSAEVLIHSAKESVSNAYFGIKAISIHADEKKTALITKSNMNSISTEENPCADDKTLTRADSAIKKVM